MSQFVMGLFGAEDNWDPANSCKMFTFPLIAKKKSDRVLNNNHRYADDTTLMAETKED